MLDFHLGQDGVATLALDRPEVLNALNGPLVEALLAAVERVRADPAARVLLLTGRGRAFCAGIDLRDPMMNLEAPGPERARRFLASTDAGIHALARALANLGKPKVCAVNGLASGGGASLALQGDIVLAARSAYFQLPFAPQLGLVPDLGGSYQFMHRLGPARAIALAMLGERLPAAQAAEWGLVWQCVEDEALPAAAEAIAGRLAQGAPQALAALPGLMWSALRQDFSAQLDLERDTQADLVRSDDFLEAVTAFREKRKPRFGGR